MKDSSGIIRKLMLGLFAFLVIVLSIIFIHDNAINKIDVKDFEVKEGTITDVKIEKRIINRRHEKCERIDVDDYEIFVRCQPENQFEQKNKMGDKIKYYVYKDKAYYTEKQMKSATPKASVLDNGVIIAFGILLIVIMIFRKPIFKYFEIDK